MMVVGAKDCGVTRVAVIGAGAMGSGIAAQFANAGIVVDLLDLVDKNGVRDGAARAGLTQQLKSGGFMDPSAAANITCGNIYDDLARVAQADWIIEAIVENLEVKRGLYERLNAVRKVGLIVSSNTSTIRRADLVHGIGDDFERDFVVTHFFNPPRHMPLVEIVTAPETDADIAARVASAARVLLGKTVVECRDTPGFIANRIGCFWMAAAALEAKQMGLDVETADAVHTVLGIPRTGVFGLFDLVGIDLVPEVWGNLLATLPLVDALQKYNLPADRLFTDLVKSGRFGRKTGAGFYRKSADGTREALDLKTGEYWAAGRGLDIAKDLSALLDDTGPAGQYANKVIATVVSYAATHAADLAQNVAAIDTAISFGYSWKSGPFSLADKAGLHRIITTLQTLGQPVPSLLQQAADSGGFYANGGLLSDGSGRVVENTPRLADSKIIFGNAAATLHDLGDGVACFRLHTKMNSFAPAVFDLLEQTLDQAGKAFNALVLASDNPRAFSVGADLSFFLEMLDQNGTAALEEYMSRGQKLFLAMRYAQVPVVAAVHGFALGGGCEFMLHAHAVIAHAELKAGVPETKVGLIPAWGGCTTLLARALAKGGGPVVAARQAFSQIFSGQIENSGLAARRAGLLCDTDEIVMHSDDVLPAAKQKALDLLASGDFNPTPSLLQVAGQGGKAGLLVTLSAEEAAGRISATDYAIGEVLASILTGGKNGELTLPITEKEMIKLERAAILQLAAKPTTRVRMEHMLKTGRALRN